MVVGPVASVIVRTGEGHVSVGSSTGSKLMLPERTPSNASPGANGVDAVFLPGSTIELVDSM